MENMVSIKGLSKAFGSHRVLKNIDLDVNIKKLNVKEGGTVLAKNDSGRVVIRVESSGCDTPHQGIAYRPNSPWSNTLVSADTGGSGVPQYKKIEAMVSSAKGESVTAIDDF